MPAARELDLSTVGMSADEVEQWFVARRWGGAPECPTCHADAAYAPKRIPAPYRCTAQGCRRQFGVRTDTFMHLSKLSLSHWYVLLRGLKGVLWDPDIRELARVLRLQVNVVAMAVMRVQQAWREDMWLPYPREHFGDM